MGTKACQEEEKPPTKQNRHPLHLSVPSHCLEKRKEKKTGVGWIFLMVGMEGSLSVHMITESNYTVLRPENNSTFVGLSNCSKGR